MLSPGERDFHHPYEPYKIQTDLMRAIYAAIEESKVGIFESPTGTGKSLSLICSSSAWLRTHQEEAALKVTKDLDDEQEPAWVIEQAVQNRRAEIVRQHTKMEARLKSLRQQREIRTNHDKKNAKPTKKSKHNTAEGPQVKEGVDSFELEEYESDNELPQLSLSKTVPDQGLSTSSLKMMEQLGLVLRTDEDDDPNIDDEIKIFYCSRTHSQLQQFVHELRRVKIPAPWWSSISEAPTTAAKTDLPSVKHISLGSRKNLCIHPKVAKLGNTTAINERCLELQQPKIAMDKKCPYLPKKGDESTVNEFRDHTMASIYDIEEIGNLGSQLGICPYYASRASATTSEIITLPYPLLLQRSAREALGLSLKGHVIVIDEAHNLMDTISNIHSSSISLSQLKICRSSLGIYLQRFRQRLKGKNRVYIAQLVRLIDSLVQYAETRALKQPKVDGIIQISELLEGKGVDQINLNKLMIYLEQSKLARKVEGYVQYDREEKVHLSPSANEASRTSPVLTAVQSFLQVLNNPVVEGSFFFEKIDSTDVVLKYMLLDPSWHFKDVVEEARSVILLGGTMSPMEDYTQYLFPYLSSEQITTWSCGHIIPKENLIALPITRADDYEFFDFTYEKRNSPQLIKSLGRTIKRLAHCIPDGLVVFFPSYAYLDKVVNIWQSSNAGSDKGDTLWDQLAGIKPPFRESKTSNIDEILSSYSSAVDHSQGGLLLSVVGGRLSEGINFSDALGRGIVVVGLPFPNAQSAQWKAKMDYIERSVAKKTGDTRKGREASRDFYENSCMRAVNQSIGRAIRHREDYAAIILLDRRYRSDRIQAKLPAWIRQGMVEEDESIESLTQRLESFFASKEI